METYNQVIAGLGSREVGISWLQSEGIISVDYARFGALVAGNAEHFHSLGVRRGDSVAITVSTDVEHIVAFLALIGLGAIPVSIKPARMTSDAFLLETSLSCDRYQVDYCYHTLPLAPRFRRLAWRPEALSTKRSMIVETEPRDIAFVQFSSGSTGHPKPIPITHGNLMSNLSTILSVEDRQSYETAFNFLPLNHDMGLIGGFLSNLVRQNPLLLTTPNHFLRHPIETLKVGQESGVAGMALPDFALSYLGRLLSLERREKLPADLFAQLRLIYCGAEPIRFETIERFIQAAIPLGLDPQSLFFCYGLAEATLFVTGRRFDTFETSFDRRPADRPIACVGPVLGDTEIRICEVAPSSEDKLCADEEEGAIFLRGSGVFPGYWKEDALPVNGWFRTGDIGYMRDGELYISGREKEMLIINGENIFPNDIENVLRTIPEIRDCLAMFEDDRLYLLVVPNPRTELRQEAISSVIFANFGVSPRATIQTTANHILRTTSGKPMRSESLRAARESGLLTN
jgi:fatty-acyl-CoA synthase